MKKSIFVALFSALFLLPAFGNGDPTDRLSALIGSANPTPRKITDVQILSEKLYINPGLYSDISVRYVLWNNSDNDYENIDYAFPLDYAGGGKEFENSELISDFYTESRYTVGWHDNYIRSVSFAINGKLLPYKISEEVVLEEGTPFTKEEYINGVGSIDNWQEEYKANYWDDFEELKRLSEAPAMSRRWVYTQFSIKSKETVVLEVNYSIRNKQFRRLAFYESNQWKPSTHICSLRYDFSPAAYWGDGTAGDFFVQIDYSNVLTDEMRYDFTHLYKMEGLPFSQDGVIYTYSTNNFSFKDSEPLELGYPMEQTPDIAGLMKRRISPDNYTISVSSENKKYPASNLSDVNFATAWVPSQKGGKGETITIRFKEPSHLKDLVLINGYHKNKDTYEGNNRIGVAKIKTTYLEHCPNDKATDSDLKENEQTIAFPYAPYQPILWEKLTEHPDVFKVSISPFYDDCTYVKEVEILVEDILSGILHDDLCISEILLFE